MNVEKNSRASREALAQLRVALLRLHKTLIDSERAEYEKTFGIVETPGAMLRLLMNDPWFAWLQPFSKIIVALDVALDNAKSPPDETTVKHFAQETRALLRPSEEGEGFGRPYFEALQRHPDVVLAHADVLRLLRG